MKKNSPASSAQLARQRALIRRLIEQNGWAEPVRRPLPAAANIIPFPAPLPSVRR